jgi:hypothetical protein
MTTALVALLASCAVAGAATLGAVTFRKVSANNWTQAGRKVVGWDDFNGANNTRICPATPSTLNSGQTWFCNGTGTDWRLDAANTVHNNNNGTATTGAYIYFTPGGAVSLSNGSRTSLTFNDANTVRRAGVLFNGNSGTSSALVAIVRYAAGTGTLLFGTVNAAGTVAQLSAPNLIGTGGTAGLQLLVETDWTAGAETVRVYQTGTLILTYGAANAAQRANLAPYPPSTSALFGCIAINSDKTTDFNDFHVDTYP